MSVPARIFNDMFTQKLSSAEGKDKTAEFGGSYIRDRLREVSFAYKITPPEQVTRADCQVSTTHDTMYKVVQLEPKSRAMSVSFRGQPTASYIRAPRMPAAFFTISSQMFQKPEQELLCYDMPITKIIEENSVKDMQEVVDLTWLIHVEEACQAMQYEANGNTYTPLCASQIQGAGVVEFSVRKGELARAAAVGGVAVDDATVRPLQKPDIVNLYKMLDGRRLRSERLLITEVDWDDQLMWTLEDVGDRLLSESTVDGYKYNTLMGKAYVRTIKTDILKPGNIYCFTAPQFFGRFFILNNTKFYIDKVANLITFQAWMDVAMAIANVAAVKKVELYSGNANPYAGDQALIANFIPVEEDALGAVNNRVDQGVAFPQISPF